MNMFEPLNLLFPCGESRLSGEVVSTSINILLEDNKTLHLEWKRKAWYVNASVNAFHMHRSLVREWVLTCSREGVVTTFDVNRKVRRMIALAVLNSYLGSAKSEGADQYFNYTIDARGSIFDDREVSVSCWWVVSEFSDWREIVDCKPGTCNCSLRLLIENAVLCLAGLRN